MADPGLLAALLAAALAVAPPPGTGDLSPKSGAPVPGDMSPKPASSATDLSKPPASPATEPVPGDLSQQPADPATPPPPARAAPTPIAIEGPAPAPTFDAPTTKPASGACHGSRPCKRLVILASVSGALGLATVVSGAVLATRPIVVDTDDPTMAITYRPAGTAVLTIGLGVLATGVLMTFAAVRASRQARRAALALRPRLAL